MMNGLRPVRIEKVAVYDGKLGWFHCFGTRTFISKKDGAVTYEVVGVIELENGKVIQLSTNRFVFLDPRPVGDELFLNKIDEKAYASVSMDLLTNKYDESKVIFDEP